MSRSHRGGRVAGRPLGARPPFRIDFCRSGIMAGLILAGQPGVSSRTGYRSTFRQRLPRPGQVSRRRARRPAPMGGGANGPINSPHRWDQARRAAPSKRTGPAATRLCAPGGGIHHIGAQRQRSSARGSGAATSPPVAVRSGGSSIGPGRCGAPRPRNQVPSVPHLIRWSAGGRPGSLIQDGSGAGPGDSRRHGPPGRAWAETPLGKKLGTQQPRFHRVWPLAFAATRLETGGLRGGDRGEGAPDVGHIQAPRGGRPGGRKKKPGRRRRSSPGARVLAAGGGPFRGRSAPPVGACGLSVHASRTMDLLGGRRLWGARGPRHGAARPDGFRAAAKPSPAGVDEAVRPQNREVADLGGTQARSIVNPPVGGGRPAAVAPVAEEWLPGRPRGS